MALLHQATLHPSKLEMLKSYLPTLSFLGEADLTDLSQIGAYRFDDPAGVVGIETYVLSAASLPTIHVPLTYRAEPLAGAERWLLGTMQHSVLGERWVYNGCGDPVYVAELARTILAGGTQAELEVDTPEGRVAREATVFVRGTGASQVEVHPIESFSVATTGGDTTISASTVQLVVRHLLDESDSACDGSATVLEGTWDQMHEPIVLACARG